MVRRNYAFDTKRVGVLLFVAVGTMVFMGWHILDAIEEIDAIAASAAQRGIQQESL